MNIYDIRHRVTVTSYSDHMKGAVILYTRRQGITSLNKISLNTDELIKELVSIGSIEEGDTLESYNLSQWDALHIAIRFELAREN